MTSDDIDDKFVEEVSKDNYSLHNLNREIIHVIGKKFIERAEEIRHYALNLTIKKMNGEKQGVKEDELYSIDTRLEVVNEMVNKLHAIAREINEKV